MTDQTEFADLAQAMTYCQTTNHQMTVTIAGTQRRLFPSGLSLAVSERLFSELNALQQQQVIDAYSGKNLHQFAYTVKDDGAVETRRATVREQG